MDRPSLDTSGTQEDEPNSADEHGAFGDDWVHELIAMTRPGVEINSFYRSLHDRPVPFEFDDFS